MIDTPTNPVVAVLIAAERAEWAAFRFKEVAAARICDMDVDRWERLRADAIASQAALSQALEVSGPVVLEGMGHTYYAERAAEAERALIADELAAKDARIAELEAELAGAKADRAERIQRALYAFLTADVVIDTLVDGTVIVSIKGTTR